MANYADVYAAFQNARAAKDDAAVAVLGDALRKMNGQPADGPMLPASPQAEYQMMSGPEQAGTAIEDTLRMLSNGITLGFRDKLAPILGEQDTAAKTGAAEDRSGFAGKTAEALGMVENPLGMMGKTTDAVGGGFSKFLKGLVTSSGEGALTSGVDAIGHDNPNVIDAMIKGAMFGPAARTVAKAGGAGARSLAGIFDKRPPRLSPSDVPVPKYTKTGRAQLEDPITGGRKSISDADAMDLYGRKERALDFEKLQQKAERKSKIGRGGGVDLNLRKAGEKLLEQDAHPTVERNAIDNMVEGNPLRNFASKMGVLSPGSNMLLSGAGGGLGATIGYAAGSPTAAAILAGALPAAGFISKLAANRGTRRASQDVMDTIVSGKPKMPKNNAVQDTVNAAEDPFEKMLRSLGIIDARPKSQN